MFVGRKAVTALLKLWKKAARAACPRWTWYWCYRKGPNKKIGIFCFARSGCTFLRCSFRTCHVHKSMRSEIFRTFTMLERLKRSLKKSFLKQFTNISAIRGVIWRNVGRSSEKQEIDVLIKTDLRQWNEFYGNRKVDSWVIEYNTNTIMGEVIERFANKVSASKDMIGEFLYFLID